MGKSKQIRDQAKGRGGLFYLCKDSWLVHEEEDVPKTKKNILTSPLQKSLSRPRCHITERNHEEEEEVAEVSSVSFEQEELAKKKQGTLQGLEGQLEYFVTGDNVVGSCCDRQRGSQARAPAQQGPDCLGSSQR